MTFLNPLVLLGLVAAAIPLIIHLFNFRRPKRVEFSSLVFLREVQRSTMQRVRIKQWLLLLLRTLAIALLVIGFARPTIRGGLSDWFGSEAPGAVVIIVDDSPSMTVRDAGGARSDQARRVAQAIARTTDSRDEVYIRTTGSIGTADAPGPGGAAAAARLESIVPGASTGTLESAIRGAMRTLQGSSLDRREVYVVTDLQRSILVDTMTAAPTDLSAALPSETTLRLVAIGSGDEANVSVTDVRVVSRIVEFGQPVRIEVDLINHGPTTAVGYAAGLELEGTRVAQVSADLPPGERVTLEFVASPPARGWLSGRVEIEDDAFPADNERHFTLFVPERRRLLLVLGERAETGFLQTALSPELTGDRLGFDVKTIGERALSAARLSDHDVIILHGPVSLSSGEIERLVRFVEEGGGLLWFPALDPILADYQALLTELGAGTVRGVSRGRAETSPLDVVDRIEQDHALFEGLFDRNGGAVERPEISRRLEYEPGPGAELTLMRSAGGSPYLQEIRAGKGMVLLLTSAPEPTWTDLPTRGLFLPLLYRSIFLLSSSGSVEGSRFDVLSSGEVLITRATEAQPLELVSPNGDRVVPPRRGLAAGVLLSLDGLLIQPGTYRVLDDEREVHRMAVNLDAREGLLQRAEDAEATQLLTARIGTPAQVVRFEAGDLDRAQASIAADRRGVEWWNVFLLVALLTLVAEMAVAALWKPEAAA